jgi:hypothetical protein
MALTTMRVTVQPALSWVANLAQAGGSGINNPGNITQQLAFTLSNGIANNLSGGSDELYVLKTTIAPSSAETINLRSFTDACNQATVSLARIKLMAVFLLGLNQTLPDGSVGTICTSITVGGAGSNPNNLNMGGTAPTFNVTNTGNLGGMQIITDGSPNGITVSSGAENVLITNNDSVNNAQVFIVFAGGTT